MSDLVLHEITGSPNNVKVRIGLGYKGLAYERRPVDPMAPNARDTLLALSRQPRTPVLQHGKTVVYDSSAILRYLDANFPDTPTLFSTDYATMGEIERWELYARREIGEPIGMIFGQAFAPQRDPAVGVRASALLHERTACIEDQLASRDFLVGETPTAADLALAPFVAMGCVTEEASSQRQIAAVFREMLHLGEGRDRTRAWVRRLLDHDEARAY